MKRHFAICSLVLLALGSGSMAAEFVQPTVTATYLEGGFNASLSAFMEPFIAQGNEHAARRRSRIQFSHNDTTLWVGITAYEPDMGGLWLALAQDHPKRTREADSVSIYLKTGDTISEFAVACDGALSEGRWVDGKEDPSWTAGAKWTVSNSSVWVGVLEISRDAVGLANAKAGDRIAIGATRRATMNGETSGWPACAEEDTPPSEWGALILGTKGGPFTSQFIPSPLLPGSSRLSYWLRPDGTRCTIEVVAADVAEPYTLPLLPKYEGTGGGWWVYDYPIAPGVPITAQAVMRVKGDVIHATAKIPVPMPLMSEELAAVEERVTKTVAQARALPDSKARQTFLASCNTLAAQAAQLTTQADKALASPASPERIGALTQCADQTRDTAWRSHLAEGRLQALQKDVAAKGFGVGTTHSVTKLRRYETDLEYGVPVHLRAARRERESAQVVVIPFDAPLQGVQVTWTDLTGPGGNTLSSDNVHMDLVGYVQTTTPDYPVEYVGWWADPLLPLEPFDVPIHQTQPLWLTLYAPPETPAGLYRGAVSINAGEAGVLDVPVEFEVLDYDLPLRGTLRTVFGFDWNKRLVGWYGWDKAEFRPTEYRNIPQDKARQIWDMTLSYRIYAGGLYEHLPFPREEDLDFCLERGLNNYQLGLASSSGTSDPEIFIARLAAPIEVARKKGIADMSYVYGWDEYPEQREDYYRFFLRDYGLFKKTYPDISTVNVYGNPTAEVREVLDIGAPLTPRLENQVRWTHWRKGGNEQGAYICCVPHHPYANFFIDYPAMDQRVLFWQLYDSDVTFFLYYMSNIWKQSLGENPRWPDGRWVTASHGNDNGDGQLLYPGKDAVLPSVRLANIRDGIEDYEAFAVLERLTARMDISAHAALYAENAAILSVSDEVTASLTHQAEDPLVLLKARVALDDQILKTKRILAAKK